MPRHLDREGRPVALVAGVRPVRLEQVDAASAPAPPGPDRDDGLAFAVGDRVHGFRCLVLVASMKRQAGKGAAVVKNLDGQLVARLNRRGFWRRTISIFSPSGRAWVSLLPPAVGRRIMTYLP